MVSRQQHPKYLSEEQLLREVTRLFISLGDVSRMDCYPSVDLDGTPAQILFHIDHVYQSILSPGEGNIWGKAAGLCQLLPLHKVQEAATEAKKEIAIDTAARQQAKKMRMPAWYAIQLAQDFRDEAREAAAIQARFRREIEAEFSQAGQEPVKWRVDRVVEERYQALRAQETEKDRKDRQLMRIQARCHL